MYGLRSSGGNHFSFHGGQRSDFLVLRHPEFNLGRLGSEHGVGDGWDTSRSATRRGRSLVGDKLLASSRQNFQARTSTAPRALARSMSAGSAPAPRAERPAASSLDAFLEVLQTPDALPAASRAPCSDHVSRHFREIRRELGCLKERQLRDPDGLRTELARGGTWKYWAQSLREMRQRGVRGDDIDDGFPQQRGPAGQVGVGRWKYIYPGTAPPLSP